MIYLSASAIKDYLSCPMKYYWRTSNPEERLAPNDDILIGNIIHEQLEKNWDKDFEYCWKIVKPNLKGFEKRHRDKAETCLKNFFDFFQPFCDEGDLIEHSFKVPMSNYSIVGKMDRVTFGGMVIDWKTTATPPKRLDNDIQFIIYNYAYSAIHKELKLSSIHSLFYAHLMSGSFIPYEHSKDNEDELFNAIIPAMLNSISNKFYYRNGIFEGGCYRCSYKEMCLR